MAVNTTVEVTMPAMGDSVSEGTVLEWHKQEGDQISADEVLVEHEVFHDRGAAEIAHLGDRMVLGEWLAGWLRSKRWMEN